MQLIVLNFKTGSPEIVRYIPEDIKDLEDFVRNNLGYKTSEISYMCVEDDFQTVLFDYIKEDGKMIYSNDNYLYDD